MPYYLGAAKVFSTMKIDPEDLITQAEAARIRGTSPQAIAHLMKAGRFKTVTVAGRVLLFRHEVENYESKPAGRPKKKRTDGKRKS